MSILDLLVLFGTLGLIVGYGVYKTYGTNTIDNYLRGGNSMKWGTIGLSVMATQASAITFISTPGQGYESGMAFVQNYFGLPIALIIVAFVFIPIYYKLKVYTAYEYLEKRFDKKTRLLGAFLFLVQRGLAAGITIYAPAIILSTILGWSLTWTILLVGVLVIIYTVSGGTKAVSLTQKHQMTVILIGMAIAFGYIVHYLSDFVTFPEALHIAGSLDKLNAVDFSFDFEKRYTVWSGILGGLFLALSYFGTDQSQVQRYLGGKNTVESRMGLMFNAILKIPMQFFILLTGALLYVFYIFYQPPVHFNAQNITSVEQQVGIENIDRITTDHDFWVQQRKESALNYAEALTGGSIEAQVQAKQKLQQTAERVNDSRTEMKELIASTDAAMKIKDSDYVFLTFILNYLPQGIIGLLIAVIFSAAMSSTSGELNALASTTVIDFYKNLINPDASENRYMLVSKLMTAGWGILAIGFAFMAHQSENLIEMVNILGSLFYGNILGIFLVAFFVKFVQGTAVFWAAIVSQLLVIGLFLSTDIGYLWFNVIGCTGVLLISLLIQTLKPKA
ncbi:sodium:solute symporter [Reichenbachiella carrageenanivorans]|uniref:Sodium:solute symporter n=1 Tax=Reichenbachiella carrageenanivorans TaxID=2979869 RepID=A0ABY6CZC2_9BACT|nr:sodium:solute symporter [Reichenbachiella carrageenanivorans]UXX79274.1 sodium:solute symporter [Reichenbachiella carrageenanivorans]